MHIGSHEEVGHRCFFPLLNRFLQLYCSERCSSVFLPLQTGPKYYTDNNSTNQPVCRSLFVTLSDSKRSARFLIVPNHFILGMEPEWAAVHKVFSLKWRFNSDCICVCIFIWYAEKQTPDYITSHVKSQLRSIKSSLKKVQESEMEEIMRVQSQQWTKR